MRRRSYCTGRDAYSGGHRMSPATAFSNLFDGGSSFLERVSIVAGAGGGNISANTVSRRINVQSFRCPPSSD